MAKALVVIDVTAAQIAAGMKDQGNGVVLRVTDAVGLPMYQWSGAAYVLMGAGGQDDTAANWTAKNPVLAKNTFGFENDGSGLYKRGDGVTAWNSLGYLNSFIQQSTWAARAVTGLSDGQEGDFSATFGKFTPKFKWDAVNGLWQPTAPIVLGTVVNQQVLETTTTAETLVGAAAAIPAGLLRAGGEVRLTAAFVTSSAAAVAHTLRGYFDTAATGLTGTVAVQSALNGAGANVGMGVDMKMDVMAPNALWIGRNTNGWVGGQTTTFNLTSIDTSSVPSYFKWSLQVAATGVDVTLKLARVVYYPPGA